MGGGLGHGIREGEKKMGRGVGKEGRAKRRGEKRA